MCKWVFPPNNNAVINGINDAGIATFASTMYDSLVRESIQNSLDAKADWADGPVEVHFTQENIPRNKIPGYESLSEALKKCEVVESNNELTRNFFKTAYETLDFNSINVLKISDYNTTGLKGSSSGKSGTAWSRLVKESGRSDLPGRPILYETTNDFLDYFGLSNIKELPDMEKYIEASEAEIEEEKDLYTSKYKEEKDNENR